MFCNITFSLIFAPYAKHFNILWKQCNVENLKHLWNATRLNPENWNYTSEGLRNPDFINDISIIT